MERNNPNIKRHINIMLCMCLILAGACIYSSCTNSQLTAKKNKPNVILIMTDDQGYGEMSCHGNPILETPNLDLLAQESIRFSDFHAAPMCAPTRGQLLTGLDAAKNGTINVSSGRTLLRPELPTIADYFSDNGYATGIFGKWHLGDNYPYRPQDRGFQESIWFPSSHVSSVPDFWGNDYFDDTYMHNGKREKFQGYCTDLFFDKAMDFITEKKQANKPFFVYLPTNAPHWPHFAPNQYVDEMEKIYASSFLEEKKYKNRKEIIGYFSMIRNIDDNMGRLRNFLKHNHLEDNTIVIFLSDNGSTYAPLYFNAGMRGKKTQLWEGGHRVPLFIRYPNGNFSEPHDVSGLAHVQDLLPTLIDLCDLQSNTETQFDGISLRPQLETDQNTPEDRTLVINYSKMPVGFDYPSEDGPSIMRKNGSAVLWKRWRLIENRELYNLETDPMQEENVIEKHPDIAEKMHNHLDQWWDDVKDAANEPQRVIIGSDNENPSMLTSCEWLDVFLDMNYQVRKGTRKNGYWKLDVEQAGTYEFELRRWPRELDIPLSDNIANSKKLPIAQARIFISGAHQKENPFGFTGFTQKTNTTDKFAKFTVELDKGPITLHTWLDDESKEPICGAYYVYVKRI